jgi:hypothetical protein
MNRPRLSCAGVLVAVVAALAAFAAPAAAIPPGDPGDPGPGTPGQQCLERTRATSTSVNQRTTFGVETVRYSWNIDPGCSGLRFSVAGKPVGPKGSMEVSVPTSRYLSVRGSLLGTGSGEWGRQFVLAGRFVSYTVASNGALVPHSSASSGDTAHDLTAKKVAEAVRPQYLGRFNGKVLQIHRIPSNRKVTDLPPWDHLDPTDPTDNPSDGGRTWGDLRGISHATNGSTGLAIAVGEERPAYTVAHELGHVMLSVGAPELIDDVDLVRAAQAWALIFGADTEPVGCDDSYSLSSVDEYWAEGTAALFNTQEACSPPPVFSTEYTPAFLKLENPQLYDSLRRVFTAS